MWLLGGEYEHWFFGSSVLGPGRRHALTLGGDGELIFHDAGDRVTTVPPYGGKGRLQQYQVPELLVEMDDSDAMAEGKRNAIALMQVTQWIFDHLGETTITSAHSGQ